MGELIYLGYAAGKNSRGTPMTWDTNPTEIAVENCTPKWQFVRPSGSEPVGMAGRKSSMATKGILRIQFPAVINDT